MKKKMMRFLSICGAAVMALTGVPANAATLDSSGSSASVGVTFTIPAKQLALDLNDSIVESTTTLKPREYYYSQAGYAYNRAYSADEIRSAVAGSLRSYESASDITVEYSLASITSWHTSPETWALPGTCNYKVKISMPGYDDLIVTSSIIVHNAEVTVTLGDYVRDLSESKPAASETNWITRPSASSGSYVTTNTPVYSVTLTNTAGDMPVIDQLEWTVTNTNYDTDTPGTYPLTVTATVKDTSTSADHSSWYDISYVTGFYIVVNTKYEALEASFSAVPYEDVYDGEAHPVIESVSGSYVDDATVEYSTDNGTTWSTTIPTVREAGSTAVKIRVTYSGQTFIRDVTAKVVERPVTIAATSVSKEEGAANPVLSATVTGLLDGHTAAYDLTNTKEGETAVGEYTGAVTISNVVIRDASSADVTANYDVTSVPGNYTIYNGEFKDLQAGFAVAGYTGEYDGREHTITISGLTPNAVVEYSTDGTFWSTGEPYVKDVGDSATYYVRAYISGDVNMANRITKRVTLKVTKRAATITARPAEKYAGDEDPAFSAVVSGIIANESFDYTVYRTDEGNERVGVHSNVIKVQLNAEYPNYTITLKSANLTVKQSEAARNAQGITVTGFSGPYDGQPHTVTVKIDNADGVTIEYSTDNGSTWSGTAPQIVNVADSCTVQVRATAGTITKTASTAIRITRAPATIIVDPAEVYLGEDYPEFTATVDGAVGNDTFKYTIAAEKKTKAGTYNGAIKLTLVGEYPNYSITIRNGVLTVLPSNAPTLDDEDDLPGEDLFDPIELISDDLELIEEPVEEIIYIAEFEDPEPDEAGFDTGEEDELYGSGRKLPDLITEPDEDVSDKRRITAGEAAPYIIGTVIAGAVAVGMGVTGGASALWLGVLSLLFAKKRKHWHGRISHIDNFFVKTKVGEDGEDAEDMQDLINKGMTVLELRTVMESSGVETILPPKTKMSIDIEGIEKEFEADEDIFYRELSQAHGRTIVNIYNPLAKLSYTLDFDLD